MRHGCLIALGLCLCATCAHADATPADNELATVPNRDIALDYAVAESPLPLLGVELWYTFDRGDTWRLYGRDADLKPPMTFHAPQGGLCGFYFVLTNAAGPSGPPPALHTTPQLWVLIDEDAPIVQLHRPTIAPEGGAHTTLWLRWTVLDDGLGERPIELSYRALPDGAWQELARELPNTGAYDWQVPDALAGEVAVRLTATDRAGHRTEAMSPGVVLPARKPLAEAKNPADELASARSTRALTAEDMKRARDLLRMGRRHALHGAHDLAVGRYRDALQIDPEMPEALVGLGASLYALGEYDASAHAYELALRYTPDERQALEGIARTLVALQKYDAAEARLMTIVEHEPQDVETWLHLGDVAIYKGNEVSARDYYMKAATKSPDAVSVVARARARLDDLPSLHRRWEATETP
ncbi:MAG TPA: tetratricopeptide repeat protein [Phycisphaerae bacterium]|nr:tetratricopeptide repeat protein [Phycisphaerales bacterium]HRX85616.1 tetratricopeptide repeat protein [Phycisphaerae bacterium]